MTTQQVIALLKQINPEAPADLRGKLKLKRLGSGAFRTCHHIVGTNLAVKFPLEESEESDFQMSVDHSWDEQRKYLHFYKFRFLRPYLVKIHFHNRKTGVILCDLVKESAESYKIRESSKFLELCHLTGVLIQKLTKRPMTDIQSSNMIVNENDDLKFVDLGY